jgi:hypothetical protein
MTLLYKELDPRAALIRIEQDIAAAEQRLVHQRRRIWEGAADSQDTSGAQALLRVMERSLGLLREHRELIRRRSVVEEDGLGSACSLTLSAPWSPGATSAQHAREHVAGTGRIDRGDLRRWEPVVSAAGQ